MMFKETRRKAEKERKEDREATADEISDFYRESRTEAFEPV